MEELSQEELIALFKPETYPFFKFTPTIYSNGEITLADPFTQGVFINILCLYWPRAGKLTLDFCKRQLPFMREVDIQSMIDLKIIKIDKKGFISISFLNEQMAECAKLSKKNKGNGNNGGRPPKNQNKPNENPEITQNNPKDKPKKSNKNEIRQDKNESNTTVGSSVTYSEASNGYANSETLWPLWGQVSSKANLNEAERVIAEKQSLHWLDQILSSPLKEKMLERTWWILEHEPDMFETGQMTIQTLESIFDMTKP